MMLVSKKNAVVIAVIIASFIIIVGFLFAIGVFKSDKQKVIDKICGTYNVTELMYQAESIFYSSTFEYAQMKELQNQVVINKYNFSIINKETNKKSTNQTSVKYIVKEIDDSFLNNGIRSQGIALRNGFSPIQDDLKKFKHRYAIFIESPAKPNLIPPQHDRFVIYFLDNKLYMFNDFDMLRLEAAK